MQLKVRDGTIFELEKVFKNDNYINLRMDYLDWGIGFNFCVGDSKRYIDIDLLCFHLWIWF